ncbi:hypothetical protein I6G97_10000 [Edwardsiella hoshinae]|uniref:Uncharacterized protein n=1 Tax=Edwardsiella hoshinae TaxID=93378 RepID=A0A376DJ13_9GAMM|nr:hypothetical protein [Edwardsiella hoshinae]QPR26810.1 hypothetical protein I6G97_10000 [Edwardsiella hoshinae]STC89336.1 Uncharacterised protein [Edwardsiella hoshinae]
MKLLKKISLYVAAFLSPWFVFYCGGGEFFTFHSGVAASISVFMVIVAFVIISIEEM